jgi:type 2 lantibiotic biosynthesis protein LanM
VLDQFLRLTGVSKEELSMALSVRFVSASAFEDASWYQLLVTVLSSEYIAASNKQVVGAAGLRKALYPFLSWAEARIDELSEIHAADWNSLRTALLIQLSEQLGALSYRTFILEANILWQCTGGASGQDKDSIVDRFAQAAVKRGRYLQRLYLTYPGLTRLIATTLLQWRQNVNDVLTRLREDGPKIQTTIFRGSPGTLQSIEGTLSDPHDGGKRVLILGFADGRRLVYKPRSVEVDVGYQQLISWLNSVGIEPRLRVLDVVAGSDYGWVEFVESAPLPAEDSARQFYIRHGILLAVLYLMKATDFHSENIIASGEQPVLVDLETLMHADAKLSGDDYRATCGEQMLRHSVFACGLLPGWASADLETPSPDLSGIGNREGQYYKNKSDVIETQDDGAIRVVRKRVAVLENANRPTYEGKRVNPSFYSDEVTQGFETCYRVLQANASALLSPWGPVARLLGAKVRHVPLATFAYAALLHRATHPDFLGRSVYRELVLANLAQRSRVIPSAGPLLKSELAALFAGDIPRFTSFPQATSVFDEQHVEIPDFLEEDAATAIRARAAGLAEDNLAFQKDIVRLSMATLRRRGEPGTESALPRPVPENALDRDEIVSEIRTVAGMVCDRAIQRDEEIDWIGLAQNGYDGSRLSAVGPDLYDGVSGIGVFLCYAGARLVDDRLLHTARLCGQTSLAAVRHNRTPAGGAFSGRGSVAYGLLHIATVLQEQAWFDRAIEFLLQLSDDPREDKMLDVISGSAGMCGVLVAAYRLTHVAALLDAAVRAAEHLLATHMDCEMGYGWPSRNSRAPLTGFAHGAAGFGWALLQVGHHASRDDFTIAGMKAFEYERSVYCDAKAGWPDFREGVAEGGGGGYPVAWCHGAPGIGLARAALPPGCIGKAEMIDIDNALETIRTSAISPTDCLCHGEFGNIELLLWAAGSTGRPHLRALAKRRATGAIQRFQDRRAWRCGCVPNEPVPGLLTGLAGIGYGMLRCYFPDETPSILAMEPPPSEIAAAESTAARKASMTCAPVCE